MVLEQVVLQRRAGGRAGLVRGMSARSDLQAGRQAGRRAGRPACREAGTHPGNRTCSGVPVRISRLRVDTAESASFCFDLTFLMRWPSSRTTRSAPGACSSEVHSADEAVLRLTSERKASNPMMHSPPCCAHRRSVPTRFLSASSAYLPYTDQGREGRGHYFLCVW